MNTIKQWPTRKKNSQLIRVDSGFVDFMKKEYPNCENPERSRRIKEKLQFYSKALDKLLYGR